MAYDELHHFNGAAWGPIGPVPPTAGQMLSQTPQDPVQSSQPMRPSGQPPPSNKELVNKLAAAPPGTFSPHADSIHQAAKMRQEGGFHKLRYPTVTEREMNELAQNVRGNAASIAPTLVENGTISVSEGIDLYKNSGAIDDSTAKAAKKSLAPVPKKGR